MQRAGCVEPALLIESRELLFGRDCVFRGFGYPEFANGFGSDLDWLTGLGVATHAGLAVGLYQAAQARNHEHAVFSSFL